VDKNFRQIAVARRQIEKAIERNIPFVLKMAGGNEYRVPHRDYIVLPPRAAYVILFDESDPHDAFDALQLLTMTGLPQQALARKRTERIRTRRENCNRGSPATVAHPPRRAGFDQDGQAPDIADA
jgi:hypothetical protein